MCLLRLDSCFHIVRLVNSLYKEGAASPVGMTVHSLRRNTCISVLPRDSSRVSEAFAALQTPFCILGTSCEEGREGARLLRSCI